MEHWGDVAGKVFLNDLAPVLLTLIMGYLTVFLHKFLAKYHLTFLQGTIEKHAEEFLLAETNKAALALTAEGNKIRWGTVLAGSISQLIDKYPKLTPERANGIVQAMMLKTPGIGPMDLGGQNGPGPGKSAQAVQDAAGQGTPGQDRGGRSGSGAGSLGGASTGDAGGAGTGESDSGQPKG
jgi:hypothetical protein